MTTYHPDTLRQLLADDEENITLADELESAIAHTIGKVLGDKNLAVFALANDVMPALVNKLESLDLNRYEIEPATSKPLTAAEHGDKTALNGNTVAYNIGHEVLEALYKVPADEVLIFFDAEGAEDLESTLQWWHENINDEA